LRIVDSHVHVSTSWYEPVETLLFHMDQHGVAQAVLVQESAQTDNTYLFECALRYPTRFPVVVNVDSSRPDAIETVEDLVAKGASGLRLKATVRSPGGDPYAIWRVASRLGVPISCSGLTADYLDDEFTLCAEAAADVPIVTEHLGAASTIEQEEVTAETRFAVQRRLAAIPNVLVKFHGFGEFSPRARPAVEPFPFELPVLPLFEHAYETFGPSRMMWGSDFPPVSRREGYRNSLLQPMEVFRDKPEAERAMMFGDLASSVFRIRGTAG
jgi:L-fuconolactonase